MSKLSPDEGQCSSGPEPTAWPHPGCYLALGPEMAQLWQEHGIASLAQYYTSRIKYDPDCFAEDLAKLRALLLERGFLA